MDQTRLMSSNSPSRSISGPQYPMNLTVSDSVKRVWQDKGSGGPTVTVTAEQPQMTQTSQQLINGSLVSQSEHRETLTPVVSAPQIISNTSRVEDMQPVVNTRTYETVRRDIRDLFPNSNIVAVLPPQGIVTTPLGTQYTPVTRYYDNRTPSQQQQYNTTTTSSSRIINSSSMMPSYSQGPQQQYIVSSSSSSAQPTQPTQQIYQSSSYVSSPTAGQQSTIIYGQPTTGIINGGGGSYVSNNRTMVNSTSSPYNVTSLPVQIGTTSPVSSTSLSYGTAYPNVTTNGTTSYVSYGGS